MSENPFKKATKKETYLRMALTGPSGGGKTYTALVLATALGKVAVLDTERGSAKKYADQFNFDVLEIDSFDPALYIRAIERAVEFGYDVMVIDSLSHAWFGTGGVLEIVDAEKKKGQNRNEFAAWKVGTRVQNELVDAILSAKLHVIATMRSKTEYIIDDKNRPRKVGLAPVQRDGMEYEFDIIGVMDIDNNMIVDKSRCPALTGKVVSKPDAAVAQTLRDWLSDGAKTTVQDDEPEVVDPAEPAPPDPPAPQPDAQPAQQKPPPAKAAKRGKTRPAASEGQSGKSELDEHLGPKLNDKARLTTNIPGVVKWTIAASDDIDPDADDADFHGRGRLFLACGGEYVEDERGRMKIDWTKLDKGLTIAEAKEAVMKRIAEKARKDAA